MNTNVLPNTTIPVDNEGYLLDPTDWNEEIAQLIAELEDIGLHDDHWQIIRFIREYFESHDSVPQARLLLRYLKECQWQSRASRKYVYRLFPYGYGQQACKIAGMRKPLKLMLDV